jgi:hypothetical protein
LDDNVVLETQQRLALGLSPIPYRNRFFHKAEVGMYQPGRHLSFHPDSHLRIPELMVFHFGFAPWNKDGVLRKTQIADKLNLEDVKRGWGVQHMKKSDELQRDYELLRASATDLYEHEYASRAIALASSLH